MQGFKHTFKWTKLAHQNTTKESDIGSYDTVEKFFDFILPSRHDAVVSVLLFGVALWSALNSFATAIID